jgi:hypothetical protein
MEKGREGGGRRLLQINSFANVSKRLAHALQRLWCHPRVWSAELQFRFNVGASAPRTPATRPT